jgi:uncharacterized protein DUF5670
MLYTIAVVLIILWALGLVSLYHHGEVHSRFAGDRDRGHPAQTDQRSKSCRACWPEAVIGRQ